MIGNLSPLHTCSDIPTWEMIPISSMYANLFFMGVIFSGKARDRGTVSATPDNNLQLTVCKNPSLRQEWRTLSIPQRQDYISAVQCLQSRPSRFGLNHTLHDEFTWVHRSLGNFSMVNSTKTQIQTAYTETRLKRSHIAYPVGFCTEMFSRRGSERGCTQTHWKPFCRRPITKLSI